MNKLLGALLLAAVMTTACSTDSFVDEIVITNPTAYRASVAVTEQDRSGWVLLTTVDPGSESSVEEVSDQGSTWIFRLSYAGHAVELEVPRDDLAQNQWSVTVPDDFESKLRDEGIPPPP